MAPILKRRLRADLRNDTSGNVAMITALALLPIIGLAGLALDFQLVVTKKAAVQQTMDATLIATARERQEGVEEPDLRVFADRQFHTLLTANEPGIDCSEVTLAFVEDSQEVLGSVSCTQPTTLSAIFGRDRFDFTVGSGSTFGVGEVDVAFVFDLSGSMNTNGRLSALQDAAQQAIDALLPEDRPDNEDVRLALVGYAHSIDAGEFFEDVVDEDTRSGTLELSETAGDTYEDTLGIVQIDQSNNRRFFDFETIRDNGNNFTDFAGRFFFESTCVYNRIGEEAFTDAAPEDGQFIFAAQPFWDYGVNRGDEGDGNAQNAKESGEARILQSAGQFRDGEFGLNSGLRNSSGNNSLSGRSGAFNARTNGINASLLECPESSAPLPLTSDRNDLENYIEDLEARGGTAGHLGIAWGWYLLSPNWASVWPADSEPTEYDEEDTAKALIIMTDGLFNSTNSVDFVDPDLVENPETGDPYTSNEMAAEYCDAIKDDTNITIFTVGFQVPDNPETIGNSGQSILEYCASSDEFAFDADNSEELTQAYSAIAAEISDLRISN